MNQINEGDVVVLSCDTGYRFTVGRIAQDDKTAECWFIDGGIPKSVWVPIAALQILKLD